MKLTTRLVCAVALAAMGAFAAMAQPAFSAHEIGGDIRDVAIARDSSAVYTLVRDKAEVWKLDPDTGDVLATGSSGPAPTAIALDASGSIASCLNRGADTLTLLRADNLSLVATVTCGKGATDVAALPGGGFAVVNTFGDSVTLVSTNRPEATTTLPVAGVPNSIAASTPFVAVGTRTPAAVRLFRASDTKSSTVELPAVPIDIVALPNATFAVLTKEGIVLVDGTERAIVADRKMEAQGIAARGSGVVVLTADGVVRLDDKLKTVDSTPLDEPANAIAANDDLLVVVSTQSRKMHVLGEKPVVASTTVEPSASPSSEQPSVAQSESVPRAVVAEVEPSPLPAPEADAHDVTPVSPIEEPAAAPAPASAPVVAQTEPIPVAKAEEPAASTVEAPNVEPDANPDAAKKSGPVFQASLPPESSNKDAGNAEKVAEGEKLTPSESAFGSMPLGAAEVHAPRASDSRPSAVPIPRFERPRFGEGITSGQGLGSSQGGFIAPSLEILKNVSADGEFSAVQDPETQQLQEVKASGNVRLSLDNMDFASDYFYYSATTGQLEAEGNVEVTQGMSKLNADSIHYTLPTAEQLEAIDPLLLADSEGEDRRLSLGKVEALKLTVHEPARDLSAERVEYDFATKTGQIEEFKGRSGIYYYGGKRIRVLGPASADGEDIWVTTCNLDPPHYRIRIKRATISENDVVIGKNARLQLGSADTPVYWPKWAMDPNQDRDLRFDFDSGHSADIGYYVNLGQRFAVNNDVDLGVRLLPTTQEGVGFGLEAYYDFLETPASPLYRAKGEVRTLYTTEGRGYLEFYHRQDIFDDAVLRLQAEQWSDEEFYKDFFYEAYRDRTAPRTFANLTYAQPEYIATATVRANTHGFTAGTERLPEVTYHLLERRIAEDLYFTFDTINGYNEREPSGTHAVRSVNVARLTYDLGITETWNLTPFIEGEGSWYSDGPNDEGSDSRFSTLAGLTLQTRFHRAFPGALGFSGFKHIVVPSVTYSYRPESSMSVESTPQFDAYDNVYGRSRIESKIDNIVLGRDARTKESWQVARLTLYQGSDFWNETRASEDYELELDLRPRPWWGWQLAGEHHSISDDFDLDEPYLIQRVLLESYERIVGEPLNPESNSRYNAQYGDYDRVLTYLYYDDRNLGGRLNGRVGFAYTDTLGNIFNREVLYGVGYRIGEKWGVSFEHRYDFERSELTRQEYELSRDLHCWEASVRVRERESGWDFGVELSIKAFPGTGVKF